MSSQSSETTTPARLSVVVAAQDARATIGRCLQELEHQRPDGVAQLIVVANSSDGTADYVRQHFARVEVVEHRGWALVPELWGDGILRSREEIVALTTAQMVPDAGWARALLREHAGHSWAGVGGPILPAPGLGMLDQAVYWLRYSRYAARQPAGVVHDIAGDNASYRRALLLELSERIRREGFWEHEVHALLRQRGARLSCTPHAVMRYHGGTRFRHFARQRLSHGRRFGAQRIAHLGGIRRLLMPVVWPLTPAVFLARIWRDALRAGGSASLLKAMPVLLCLLICWSAGELLGYLSGKPEAAVAVADQP